MILISGTERRPWGWNGRDERRVGARVREVGRGRVRGLDCAIDKMFASGSFSRQEAGNEWARLRRVLLQLGGEGVGGGGQGVSPFTKYISTAQRWRHRAKERRRE